MDTFSSSETINHLIYYTIMKSRNPISSPFISHNSKQENKKTSVTNYRFGLIEFQVQTRDHRVGHLEEFLDDRVPNS